MISNRLKQERERLGFTQAQFAGLGMITSRSQQNYETTDRKPDAGYLAEIAKVGADVQYIVTGQYSETKLSNEEQQLLAAFRSASPQVRQFMLQGAQPVQTLVAGNVGQQIQTGDNAKITHTIVKPRGKKVDGT